MKKIILSLLTLSSYSLYGDADVIYLLVGKCKERTKLANPGRSFEKGDCSACLVFAHAVQLAMQHLTGNRLRPNESHLDRWADEYIKNTQKLDKSKLESFFSIVPAVQSSDDVVTKADAFTRAHRITYAHVKRDISLSLYAQLRRWLTAIK